jgi:hypothetical protein
MKNPLFSYQSIVALTLLTYILFPAISYAQTDSTSVIQPDTIPQTAEAVEPAKEKKEKKKKNSFKVYAGVNFNNLSFSNDDFESNGDLGFQLGAAYKSGGFFYWELGARFNRMNNDITTRDTTSKFHGSFGVSQVDIPVTVGINILSATARLLGLRVFVSGVPSFVISVDENETNLSKDDLNSFMFQAAGGIGVDVAFFFLETGFQYGFTDLFQNINSSNPGQFFINLGFRF